MDSVKEKGVRSERRTEPRQILKDYYSVEFTVSPELPVHQFRIRNMSPCGLAILVNETSAALKTLKAGDIVEMKYNPVKPSDPAEHLKTKIRHITRLENGPFTGHYLVGIRILDREGC